ncbi:Translation initiation factor IF-2 [Aedoeadaptatus ivorii]|uniref:Translation initiation factor IF-2 n=1 Tax=Aedoeadaptatus ivorii TaxID=54006 RepID=A0A3S5BW69_9FIRM|nr:translation initiation factor IF-2 [Peptoniphilus ivorii]VEJ35640.1 Translation initiation factor IF-2 [Peptoniphilus ivorii]
MSNKRVYTVAKEIGMASKDLMDVLKQAGMSVKSHMSTLSEEEQKQLYDFIRRAQNAQEEARTAANVAEENRVEPEKQAEKPSRASKHGNVTSDKAEQEKDEELSEPKQEKREKKSESPKKDGSKEKKTKKKDVSRPNLHTRSDDDEEREEKKSRKRDGGKKKHKQRDQEPQEFDKPKHPKKKSRSQKRKERQAREMEKGDQAIKIKAPLTVKEFSGSIGVNIAQVITKLIGLGIMATQNESIDEDVIAILADEFGKEVEFISEEDSDIEELYGLDPEDPEESLKKRPPVVTVMGHVDHGKTSILDVIKKSHVTASEAGGITQHIGAYQVSVHGENITFLDTPGHEAFTAMRSRGASVTDIAILVVAADDGVMPQTVEAIHHAKAAEVPIIVAINKIDREGANPDRVRQELAEEGLVSEDWGGDTIMVEVSAKTKEGIPDLLDMVLLVAEVQELKANPDRLAVGTVVEARLDKGKGPMATILVQKGTLTADSFIVSGTSHGHIRAMTDDKKKRLKKAGPSTPVVILGLDDVPNAGDTVYAVKDEKTAKEIASRNIAALREEKLATKNKISMSNLFEKIKEGELKDLNLIVKADVKGTVEAINQSLLKLNENDEVKVNIIHSGAGGINESDINLASASNALVIGFNVRPNINAIELAKQEEVDVRTYRVIYDIINDVKGAVSGMLTPDIEEEVLGRCEVRDTFKLPNNNIVAGIYVLKGKIVRNGMVKVLRDDIVIHEGPIASLKRFKDDAKEIAQGYEGGLMVENFNDIQVKDLLECYIEKEIKKEL